LAIDYFAVASNGGFPTPTPTDEERMSFIGTWGYFGEAPEGEERARGLSKLGMSMRLE